jgi:uncharacterized protein YgiB involved in biofilm formation
MAHDLPAPDAQTAPDVAALQTLLDAALNDAKELRSELEETNRGVVALYSELDVQAEELRHATELKSRFLAYMSHEFRTPLTSMTSIAGILLSRLDGPLTPEQQKVAIYNTKAPNDIITTNTRKANPGAPVGIKAGDMTAAQCQTAYDQAQKDSAANAPKFGDQQSCEERYGVSQCVPRNDNNGGGSFFTPLLTGFIVGQALSNMGGGYYGAPMYRDRNGTYYGGGGYPLSRDYVTGRTRVRTDSFNAPEMRTPTRVQSRSSVISRGGFGGGGRSFGG